MFSASSLGTRRRWLLVNVAFQSLLWETKVCVAPALLEVRLGVKRRAHLAGLALHPLNYVPHRPLSCTVCANDGSRNVEVCLWAQSDAPARQPQRDGHELPTGWIDCPRMGGSLLEPWGLKLVPMKVPLSSAYRDLVPERSRFEPEDVKREMVRRKMEVLHPRVLSLGLDSAGVAQWRHGRVCIQCWKPCHEIESLP